MADRYWRAASSGTWSATATTFWSATSGGTGGASAPTSADNVIFDRAGTYTITLSGTTSTPACASLTVTAGTVSFGGTGTPNINGSMTLRSAGTWTGTGTISFNGSGTINTAGKTLGPSIIFNGSYTLSSSLSLAATRTTSLTAGTLDLANFTLTTGIFSSNNSNTRSISFGTGNIVLAHTTAAQTVLAMATAIGFTCTGTGGFTTTMSVTRTFTLGTSGSPVIPPNLSLISGASAPTLTSGSYFQTLDFGSASANPNPGASNIVTLNLYGLTLNGSWGFSNFIIVTMIGTGTITSNGRSIYSLTINNSSGTTTLADNLTTRSVCTLTAGTLALANFTLTIGGTGVDGGFISDNSNTRSISFGTGTIELKNGTPSIGSLQMATATGFTYTGTSNFTSTITTDTSFDFGSLAGGSITNSPNLTFTGSGTAVPTFTTGSWFKTLNFGTTAFTVPATVLNLTNLTLSSGGTFTGLSATMRSTGTITSAVGKTIAALTINISSGTTTLATDLELIATGTCTLTLGTLDLANFTLTTGIFSSNNSNTRSISFGTGNIVLAHTTADQTVLSMAIVTGFTYTGTGGFTSDASVTRTFTFGTTGGSITNSLNLTFTGSGTAIQTFTSNSWFNTLSFGTTAFTVPATVLNLTNLTLSSGGTFTGLSATMRSTGIFTTNSKQIATLSINSTAGTTTAVGAVSCTTFTVTSGTIDFATYSLTCTNSITGASGAFAPTGTLNLNSITCPTYTVNGTLTLTIGQSLNGTTSIVTATAFTINGTLTTPLFTHTSGTVTLGTNVTLAATGTYTLTAGTLDLANFTLTTGIFSSNNSNTRSISFGTGNIVLAHTTADQTVLSMAIVTGFTYTGTGGFTSDASVTRTFTFGTTGGSITNSLNLTFTGSGTAIQTFTSNSWFNTLSFGTTPCTAVNNNINIVLNLTNLTLSSGGTFTGLSATMRSTGIFTTNSKQIATLSINSTAGTTTAVGAVSCTTFTVTSGTIDFATYSLTCTNSITGDTNAFAPTGTLNLNSITCPTYTVNGTLTLTIGQSLNGTTSIVTATAFTINGTLTTPLFTHTSGTVTLGTNVTLAATGTYTLTAGTLDLANFTLTTGIFSSNNSNTRSISFGIGNIVLAHTTAAQIVLSMATATGFTYTGTGGFTSDASVTRTFQFGQTTGGSTTNSPNLTLTGSGTSVQTFSTSATGGWFNTLGFGTTAFTIATTSLNLNGLTLSTSGTYTGLTATMVGTGTLTSNTNTTLGQLVINNDLNTTTLASNLSCTTFTMTAGTIDFATFNLTCSSTAIYTSGTLSNIGTISCTTWTISASSTFTLTAGTISASTQFKLTSGAFNYNGGTITTPSFIHTAGTVTLGQPLTITPGAYTLTAGTLDLGNNNLTVGIFSTTNSNTRSIAFGTNNIILVHPTVNTQVLVMLTVTGFTWTGTTGGFTADASVTRTFTVGTTAGGSSTNAPNLTFTGVGTSSQTLTSGSWFNKLDFGTTVTGQSTTSLNLNSLTLSSTGTAYSLLTANMRGTGTITYNGKSTGPLSINSTAGTTTAVGAVSCTTFTVTSGTIDFATYSLTCTNSITGDTNAFAPTGTLNLNDITCRTYTVNGTVTLAIGQSLNGTTSIVTATAFTINGTLTTPLFTHTSGTVTLGTNVTLAATGTYTLTAGTLDLANFTLTTGIFNSDNSNTRSISFGTGNIVLTHTSFAQIVLSMATATGFTYTGTGGFTSDASVTRTFQFGQTTGGSTTNSPNLTLTGSGTSVQTFTTGGWFNTLGFGTTAFTIATTSLNLNGLTLSTSGTFNSLSVTMVGGGTITSNGKTIAALTINSTSGATTLADPMSLVTNGITTLTSGTLALGSNNLTTGTFSSSNTNTRSIAFGTGNIALTHTTAATTVLGMATATGFTYTGPGGFTSIMSVTRTFVFGTTDGSTTNAPNLTLSSGSQIATLTTGSWFNTLSFGSTVFTLAATSLNLNGLTLSTGAGVYTNLVPTMVGTGSINTNGKSLTTLTINHAGTTTLASAVTTTTSTTLTSGTLALATFTLTPTQFVSGTAATRAISGAGIISLSNDWTVTDGTGFTGSDYTINMTKATAKTFAGANGSYGTLVQAGAGTLTISGSNTLADIQATTRPSTVSFEAASIQTVSLFTISGTFGNLVTINSDTPNTRFTLYKTSGTVNASFLIITDSNATGGAVWNANNGTNTNDGNNIGWDFAAAGSNNAGNFMAFF